MKALIAAVDTGDRESPLAPQLAELAALARAAGAEIVGEVVQKLPRVNAATMFGTGKVEEIARTADELGAEAIFVYNDLRPRQRKNLEKVTPLQIIDRTMLILDVFAQHARSREGKLQVELAQLRYRQANLIGIGTELSRLGGGIGTRGPGETKLETDRRKIQSRISTLRKALEDVRTQRATRRASDGREPLVALVGYTNAGKSSLLNRLTSGKDAFVADQPFATLDPLVRRAWVAQDQTVRLADTVGFITKLPEELVNAFRATLEELDSASLLVHVIDVSNPDWQRQKKAVESTLDELGLSEKPVLAVYNKVDRTSRDVPHDAFAVSALTGDGIPELRAELATRTVS